MSREDWRIKRNSLILLVFLFVAAIPPPCAGQDAAVSPVPALVGQRITAIVAVEEGAWVGTDSGVALVSPSGQMVRTFGPADGLRGGRILSLAPFRNKIYAGTPSGLSVFDGSGWDFLSKADRFSLANCYLRTEPEGGWLWVAAVNTNGALLRFDGARWEFLGGDGRGPLNNVRSIVFQGEAAWIGTLGSGVYRRTGAGIQYFKARDGLPSSTINCIEIFDGAAWAGTHTGAARFEDGRWIRMTPASGIPLSSVQAMTVSSKALFLGGAEGLFRYSSGKFERITAGDGQGDIGGVHALAYDRGVLYVGTPRGLLILKGM